MYSSHLDRSPQLSIHYYVISHLVHCKPTQVNLSTRISLEHASVASL